MESSLCQNLGFFVFRPIVCNLRQKWKVRGICRRIDLSDEDRQNFCLNKVGDLNPVYSSYRRLPEGRPNTHTSSRKACSEHAGRLVRSQRKVSRDTSTLTFMTPSVCAKHQRFRISATHAWAYVLELVLVYAIISPTLQLSSLPSRINGGGPLHVKSRQSGVSFQAPDHTR